MHKYHFASLKIVCRNACVDGLLFFVVYVSCCFPSHMCVWYK